MAAQDLERLVVQLSADITRFDRAMAKAQGVTNQRLAAIQKKAMASSTAISGAFEKAGLGAAKAFALIGGAAGAKSLLDSATKIDNALKVAGLSGDALTTTYDQLYASAQKNAAPIESLTQLYSRLALVQGELGVSSEQIVGLTDAVGKALRLTGGDAQQASGALLQLAQALGGGKVQAEEYGSLIDGMPGLLQAAAAGIKQAGGSVAELTALVKSGKISSKAFFDGIEAGSYVLDEKLSTASDTIEGSMTRLQNSLTNAAAKFNRSSQAANTFGGAIDNVSAYVDTINMDNLAEEIGKIIAVLNQGATAAQNLGIAIGKLSGLENVGASIVDALGGENGKVSYLGGLLTIESTIKSADKLNALTERRLAIEKEISEVQANPSNVLGGVRLKQLQGELTTLQGEIAAATSRPGAIEGGPLVYDRFSPPRAGGGARFKPVDITASKYTVPDDGKGGGSGKGANDYQREIEQIKERTIALQAETAAMAVVNPLIDDYGFALEKARAESDLLAAAQKEGLAITPALKETIDQLATGYANASVAVEKLQESQERARAASDDFKNTAKDITSGFISDLRSGTSAADALSNALNRVLDKVIDIGLNSIFGTGGGGGGLLAGIGAIFGFAKGGIAAHGRPKAFARGGVAKSASIFGEAGPEAAVPLPDGRSIPVKFQQPAIPRRQAGAAGPTIHNSYNIDARGADQAAVARLERGLAERDRTFGNRSAGVRRDTDVRKIRPR